MGQSTLLDTWTFRDKSPPFVPTIPSQACASVGPHPFVGVVSFRTAELFCPKRFNEQRDLWTTIKNRIPRRKRGSGGDFLGQDESH